jgi:hypothetical protein
MEKAGSEVSELAAHLVARAQVAGGVGWPGVVVLAAEHAWVDVVEVPVVAGLDGVAAA